MGVISEVLESSGVDVRYSQGDEVLICCPFCTDRGETADQRFRLGVNLKDGRAHCFNCGWKGRTSLYTARHLSHALGVKLRIRSKESILARRRMPEKPIAQRKLILPEEYESFRPKHPDVVREKAWAYLVSRGVSILQVVRHKIGFAATGSMAWRILFPVLDHEGCIVGMVGRDFSGKQSPKYLNSPGVKHLWNGVRRERVAVLVEGVLDGLRTETALLRTNGYQAVAKLGSTITVTQMNQLREFEKIIVFPDFDRAGVQGAIELCNKCYLCGMQVAIVIPDNMNGEDPGSMTDDRINECVSGAEAWRETMDRQLRLSMTREAVFGDD